MRGLLLVNLGTPEHFTTTAVRHFLREFLADPKVIALPTIVKYAILYAVILPFRPRRVAHSYQAIWTTAGSPLLVHSTNLQLKLQNKLGPKYKVALGMRYGNPSIQQALASLDTCASITVLPLFPQYSYAVTESILDKVQQLAVQYKHSNNNLPKLSIIRSFYQHDAFITAQAALIAPYLAEHDYLLFSYHGIPEKHLTYNGCYKACQDTCPTITATNANCYKAQCFATSTKLAQALNLLPQQYSSSFQSRLGNTAWIKPYTDKYLLALVQQGVKKLAIVCPSFVTDCLETLEEIGLRMQKYWQQLGGLTLTLVPCVNSSDLWIAGLSNMLQECSAD